MREGRKKQTFKGEAPPNAAPRGKKRGAVKDKLFPAFISYLFLTRRVKKRYTLLFIIVVATLQAAPRCAAPRNESWENAFTINVFFK